MRSEQMSNSHEDEDRLSNLPEDALSHILSLMPTIFAVRTSTLSKSWRYNWTLVTSLDFNDYHNPGFDTLNCQFSKFVDRVFEHCKTLQLKLFRLASDWVQKSNVSKWINKAVRLNVCELDVKAPLIELPLSLFTCKTLTKLMLDGLEDFIVPSLVILPRLKTLDIRVLGKASVNASRFIRGCPMLESLVLAKGLCNEEEDYNFNIPTLKRLILRTSGHIPWCCEFINKVVLNVPNLEYIWVGGDLCSLFVIEDLSSLVEATVDFGPGQERANYLYAELLQGISGAKSISWCSPTLDVLLKSPLPKFHNLKHLELIGPLHSRTLKLFQHLESSSKLEHLCFQEPKKSYWIKPQSVPTWMLTNLRAMEIRCKGNKCDIQFLEYVLGNSEVLKKLTVKCEGLSMKNEKRLCAQLSTFSRATSFCQIHFVGIWLSNIF